MIVLVVEDEAPNRRVLYRVLTEAGYGVCSAANVPGAARLLTTERVDVVVLDINLGDFEMSGIDLARMMGDDPDWKRIPVIVASGMPVEEIRRRSSTYAFEGLRCVMLEKPLDVDRLLGAIASMGGS